MARQGPGTAWSVLADTHAAAVQLEPSGTQSHKVTKGVLQNTITLSLRPRCNCRNTFLKLWIRQSSKYSGHPSLFFTQGSPAPSLLGGPSPTQTKTKKLAKSGQVPSFFRIFWASQKSKIKNVFGIHSRQTCCNNLHRVCYRQSRPFHSIINRQYSCHSLYL